MTQSRGPIRAWQGLIAIAVALIAALVVASQISAASGTIRAGRATVAPGAQATIALEALDVGSPGLGAWEIGVTYDPSVVSVVRCQPANGSVCNPNFGADHVRVVGANSGGSQGDTLLADITFECDDSEGTSSLTVTAIVFADATVGTPVDIATTVRHGTIDCTDAAGGEPTRRPTRERDATEGPAAATATPALVNGLPKTGSGGPDGGQVFWIFAALTVAGFAALTGVRLALRRAREG